MHGDTEKHIEFINNVKQQAREAARKGGDNWIGATDNEIQRTYEQAYNEELSRIIAEENNILQVSTSSKVDMV